MLNDVPLLMVENDRSSAVKCTDLPTDLPGNLFDDWVGRLSDYLVELQSRLFSSGLHILGEAPDDAALFSYLEAYFGEKLSAEEIKAVVSERKKRQGTTTGDNPLASLIEYFSDLWVSNLWEGSPPVDSKEDSLRDEALDIASLLDATTDEMENVVNALDGGYVPAAPGGDLLRDGKSVLPTGRNIYALDPYR
jgi:magnesium chelatase subunit H